jgi:hypothetical protein
MGIVAGEQPERHFQPGADIGIGQPLLRHRRHGTCHGRAMLGQWHHQDRVGRKRDEAKTILCPLGKKRFDQRSRGLGFGGAGLLAGAGKPLIHAEAAIEHQHHMRPVPDTRHLAGTTMQPCQPQHDDGYDPRGHQSQSPIQPDGPTIFRYRHER